MFGLLEIDRYADQVIIGQIIAGMSRFKIQTHSIAVVAIDEDVNLIFLIGVELQLS